MTLQFASVCVQARPRHFYLLLLNRLSVFHGTCISLESGKDIFDILEALWSTKLCFEPRSIADKL